VTHALGRFDSAGVKIISDFHDNNLRCLPSELALVVLLDRRIGAPNAIIDASRITEMRTGAVSGTGVKQLAGKGSKISLSRSAS
jgi:alanine dehydrogenase